MSVKRAQREIDAAEFAEWMVYAELEPWGEWRSDLRMGIQASVMANLWRGKDSKAYTAQDFMPTFGGDTVTSQETEDDEIAAEEAFLEMITASLGGEIREGDL